VFKLCSRND